LRLVDILFPHICYTKRTVFCALVGTRSTNTSVFLGRENLFVGGWVHRLQALSHAVHAACLLLTELASVASSVFFILHAYIIIARK